MKHLYFVRHGQSQANVDEIRAGRLDSPLTALGRQQAKQVGAAAKSLGIDYIVSSPLQRARDTAMIIADTIGLPADRIEILDLLVERDYGSATGSPWSTDFEHGDYKNVETMASVAKRAHLAYRHIAAFPYETILVVSHGGFWQKLYMETHPGEIVGEADEPDNAEISKLV